MRVFLFFIGKVEWLPMKNIIFMIIYPDYRFESYYLKSANLSGIIDNQPDVKIKRVKPESFYLCKNQWIKEIDCGFQVLIKPRN